MHHEVPVKVTAYVDEGIAHLVEALNLFPGLCTIDSCQGHGEEGLAHVFFDYRGSVRDLFEVTLSLSAVVLKRLADKGHGECGWEVSWDADNPPSGHVSLDPAAVDDAATALTEYARLVGDGSDRGSTCTPLRN